jgi:hypothetical protein
MRQLLHSASSQQQPYELLLVTWVWAYMKGFVLFGAYAAAVKLQRQ